MKTNYFSRIRSYLSQDRVRQREEAYLNRSISRTDLERREREVDSGLFRWQPLGSPASRSFGGGLGRRRFRAPRKSVRHHQDGGDASTQ